MNASRLAQILNSRIVYLAAVAGGMALCTRGIGQAPIYGWLHPISLAGGLLGSAALLLSASVLVGLRLGSLTISPRTGLAALAGIMIVKALLAALYPVIR